MMLTEEVDKRVRELAAKIVISIANVASNKRDQATERLVETMRDLYWIGYREGLLRAGKGTQPPTQTLPADGKSCTVCGSYYVGEECPVCKIKNVLYVPKSSNSR